MMLDWNEYQKELLSRIGEIGRTSPEIIRGYRGLADAGEKTGHLNAKIRELIALAVAVSLRCDGCITTHTSAAHQIRRHPGGDRRSPGRRDHR